MATLDRRNHLLDALLERQRQAWLEGNRPSVEELLAGTPLENDAEAQLDMVYHEVVVREELGERPTAEEYLGRYLHLKEDLVLHFEVHRALGDRALEATARVPDAIRLLGCPSDPRGPDDRVAAYGFTWYVGAYSNPSAVNNGIIVDEIVPGDY